MSVQQTVTARVAIPILLSGKCLALCPTALALGLAVGGCGAEQDERALVALPDGKGAFSASFTGPVLGARSLGGGTPAEHDLGELDRHRVDITVHDLDLLGRYIVEVAPDIDPAAIAQQSGAQPRFTFMTALRGFSAYLGPEQLAQLRSDARVLSIEPVQRVTASTVQHMDADGQPWGLDRISQNSLPLNGIYSYDRDGAGIRAYIIDTGIFRYHAEFENRALRMFDAFGGDGDDLNGHGTHVAGTIGGTTYGVAKQVQLRGVRVLDRAGSGTTDGVIAGIDWVASHGDKPAVVNMSIGGGNSEMLQRAVNNLAAAGFFTAVAAGNSGADACDESPANATGACTVGATNLSDHQTGYSNYGRCVTIYAPGDSIRSAWIGDSIRTISGTSMATPHVTGTAALYKQVYGDTDSVSLKNWLKAQATRHVLVGLGAGSPDLLLFQSL